MKRKATSRWCVGTFSGEEIELTFRAKFEDDWVGHPDVPGGTQGVTSMTDLTLEKLLVLDEEILIKNISYDLYEKLAAYHTEVGSWGPEYSGDEE